LMSALLGGRSPTARLDADIAAGFVDACWHVGRERGSAPGPGWPRPGTGPVEQLVDGHIPFPCARHQAPPAAPVQDGCGSGRRKRRTLIRTSMPLAPGEEAPGPGRPEGRRPERRWTPLAAAYPPRSTCRLYQNPAARLWLTGDVGMYKPTLLRTGARYDGAGCVR
jgi:hypothetical protein